MKVMTTSDLHLRVSLYNQLIDAVDEHKPDVLCLVGDYLDDGDTVRGMLTPAGAARVLTNMPCEVVLVRGNHEEQAWPDFEAAWKATPRPLIALHGSAVKTGRLVIVGFPCTMGFSMNYAQGRQLPDDDYETWLPPIMAEYGTKARALWLMHEPPCTTLADYWATCPQWADAIKRYQPMVAVSGHDHTTPFKNGTWMTRLGDTRCVNAGQRVYPHPGALRFCTMEFDFTKIGTPVLVGNVKLHG